MLFTMIKNKASQRRTDIPVRKKSYIMLTLMCIVILVFIFSGCHRSDTEWQSTKKGSAEKDSSGKSSTGKSSTGKNDTAIHKPTEEETSDEDETSPEDKTGSDQEPLDSSLYLEQLPTPYDGTEDNEYLKAVQEVAQTMVDNEFIYNLSGIRSSLDKAVRKKHHGDCAHLVSWALQENGILEKGQTFYAKKSGVLSCKKSGKTYANLTKAAEIIEVEGIPFSDQDRLKKVLKAGDICCYNKHMNVAAGLDDDGNILYYDAGLTPVEGHKPGGRYTEQLTEPYARPTSKNKLYTIIRLKQKP